MVCQQHYLLRVKKFEQYVIVKSTGRTLTVLLSLTKD